MLNPHINMWEMAREPMEQWAKEHLSPAGRAKEMARRAQDFARDLPEIMDQVECALQRLSDPAGVKIHAHSLNAIAAAQRSKQRQWLIFAWAALIVAALLVVKMG
jgi:ubiquinone biosynthesis protein